MINKKGFVTTGILFSLMLLMVYLISSIVMYTVKIKYTKKDRIDRANYLLDDDKSCDLNKKGEKIDGQNIECRHAILNRIQYTKEEK